MLPRFHVPALAPGDAVATLPPEEARHLVRVLRLRPGDAVRVFNGRGHEFLARVDESGRRGTTVRLIEAVEPAAESQVALTVAQSVLTGDKMDRLIRDLTMLGVAAIQPICSSRSEVSASAIDRSHRVERWRRIAVASAKQCGRAVVPAIATPLGLQDWVARDTSGVRLILVEPAGDVPVRGSSAESAGPDGPEGGIALLVGPEGGWTADEASLAVRAGFVPWTLGSRTLRADAAPVVAVSILQYRWGDLS
jgi:16S rRNA (uracil1498-N3)-methyltransferase